jgi:hypothetical protein
MLALRGGFSLGALLTGFAVDMIGIRCTLLLDGLAAIVMQAILMRFWLKAPSPIVNPASSPAASTAGYSTKTVMTDV